MCPLETPPGSKPPSDSVAEARLQVRAHGGGARGQAALVQAVGPPGLASPRRSHQQRLGRVAGQGGGERAGVLLVVGVGLGEGRALHRLGGLGDLHRRDSRRPWRARRRRHWWRRPGRAAARPSPSPGRGAAGTGPRSRGRRSRGCGAWTPGTRSPGRSLAARAGMPRSTRWRRSALRSGPARGRASTPWPSTSAVHPLVSRNGPARDRARPATIVRRHGASRRDAPSRRPRCGGTGMLSWRAARR